ncbi:MAG: zinc ribbon domain-containing protein [Actinobacteria bacterium]|nr:MAG: zinc ribbon domain-containing protein [Actinomycetota bacterium]
MKYCAQCGAPNTDEAQFCEKCGNAWVAAPVVSAPGPVVAPAPMPGVAPGTVPPARTGPRPAIFIVAAAMLLVVLGAVGVGWLLFMQPMDIAAYEDKVTEDVIATAESVTTMGEAFNDVDTSYDEPIGDENLAMLQDAVAEGIDGVQAARDDLAGLRPPKEYKRSHDRLVASYDRMLEGLVVLKEMLGEITADDTSSTLSEKFSDRTDDFSTKLEKSTADMQKSLEDMGLYESLSDELSNMF